MLKQHEDFGEKIGGAKKDLWKDRGLVAGDLDAMNEREAEKFVKKDNIWKKPDYQAMFDDGIPLGVVYFIKKARDSLNASPQYYHRDDTTEKRLARQKEYIQTVRELQSVVSEVRTVEDAMKAYDRFFVENGHLERVQGWGSGTHYRATEKGQENPAITNKLSNALMVRSVGYFERNFTQKAKKEQFLVPKEQKIPTGYSIRYNDGKNSYSQNNDWKPDTWYVKKGYSILKTNLESWEAALEWVQDFARQRSRSGKARFVPRQLEHVRRDGPDYRNGREISGQDYLDTFGFRGGEFGNWMNQKDRQVSLNMGFEALKDLASALQISDKDIAYQGELALAFGARGSGNAAAHYEPLRRVINLTKMHGAGSLAHEWWHGFDDYLGTKMGANGLLSDQPDLYPPFQKLIETMKYKPETAEQAAERTKLQDSRMKKNAESCLDSTVLGFLKRYGDDSTLEQYASLKSAFLSGEIGTVEKISALKKSKAGRVIPKSERERLETFEKILHGIKEQGAPKIGRTETDYYRNSIKMGKECEKDGGYWDSNVEMTARAFACYIKDKLPYQSDYLAGHADCAATFFIDKDGKMGILKAFPEGEERKAINAVFDEIVADLKLQHVLTHQEVTQSLAAHPMAENKQISMFSKESPSMTVSSAAAKQPENQEKTVQAVSEKLHAGKQMYDIEIKKVEAEGPLRGIAKLKIGMYEVGNIKIVEGEKGLFVSFPARATGSTKENGKPDYVEVIRPTGKFRKQVQEDILNAYENYRKPEVDIRITPVDYKKSNVKAYATITLDGMVQIGGVKLIEDAKGTPFVSMPAHVSEHAGKKTYTDMAACTNWEAKQELTELIKTAYTQALLDNKKEALQQDQKLDEEPKQKRSRKSLKK